MSKSELQSDRTNAGAAASRLRCAKKVLDIHRQFIDDLFPSHTDFSPSLFSLGLTLIASENRLNGYVCDTYFI